MPKNAAAHECSYIAWKGWIEATPFGTLIVGEKEYFRSELRKIVRSGVPVHDVLEVGYGNGAFLTYCREQGWNVMGAELDPKLVDAARKAGFDVVPAGDTAKLQSASFDLITAFDVLEHIPQDDIVGFLTGLSDKLRPGGRILLRFPNADSWLGNALQNGDPTHVTAIGYLKMTYFAQQAATSIVSFTGAVRHGFATSLAHGIYSLTAGPLVRLSAAVKGLLYFPQLPIVLWTSNVVCVLKKVDRSLS